MPRHPHWPRSLAQHCTSDSAVRCPRPVCVLRVKARGQRDLITVVGHTAAIGAGEFVQASGRWVNDRTQASST
ncbi:MAG: YrrC family ATP-dependent DNA helicase [Rhodospirillales bacterium]